MARKLNSVLGFAVKNVAVFIVKEIPTGKDNQYPRHTLKIGQGGIGETPEIGIVALSRRRIAYGTCILQKLRPFV